MTRRFTRFLVLTALAGGALVTAAGAQTRPSAPAQPPTLVVFITVDQMHPDYFERFGPQLTGGLARLYRGGAVFTHAFQDHGVTETAPGHASTLSGRFPRHTGIVMNLAGVQDPQAPLIGGGGPGASPFRFRGSTLTDWMRTRDPRTRALSVSRKDRGAILPLGRAHQQVFWYASDGRFTTSTYYADTLPTWVRRFNERRVPQRMAGQSWTPLLPLNAYPEPDSVPVESGGTDYTFPHVLPSDPAQAAARFPEFPWMDQLTLDAALEGMKQMQLGAGPQTDVLAISLSTTDAVGHRYGPDSREIHDQIVRLDRMLGAFFDSLYAVRDPSRVVVALTADHGVNPFPEVRPGGPAAASYYVDPSGLVADARRSLVAAGIDTVALSFDSGMIFVNRAAFAGKRLSADSVLARLTAAARRLPGVLRVDRVASLARQDTARDYVARRWYHMIPPDLPIELTVTLQPGRVWGRPGGSAHHGSPHDYDAHVPVIFYGPWFRPGRYDQFARVVDIGPTLARVVGAKPTEPIDGRVLEAALK